MNELYRPDNMDSWPQLNRLKIWPREEQKFSSEHSQQEAIWNNEVIERRRQGRQIRVLFCHSQFPGETGSGVYLQKIVAEAIRQGIDMHVLAAGYENLSEKDIPGVDNVRITTCKFSIDDEHKSPDAISFAIPGMSNVMPYPSITFKSLSMDQLEEYVCKLKRIVTQTIYRLNPTVISVNHCWFLTGFARLAAPWIPVCVSAHGTTYKLLKDHPQLGQWILPTIQTADHVCAISRESVRECVDAFHIPEEKMTIEGYGFDLNTFKYESIDRSEILRSLNIKFSDNVQELVLFIGKFVEWKGLDELLYAFSHLREIRPGLGCLIIGEGNPERRETIDSLISQLGLNSCVLAPGKLPRNVLPDIYRIADVFVLP